MNTYTVNGTYGSDQTATEILVYAHKDPDGSWYVCKGSRNMHYTLKPIQEGVDLSTVVDYDSSIANFSINNERELAIWVKL